MAGVDVIVAGQVSASAVVAGAKTASVIVPGTVLYPAITSGQVFANVIVPGSFSVDTNLAGIGGTELMQGAAGVDGADGVDGSISGAVGLDGAIQYKSGNQLQGAKAFFYERANDILRFSGQQLIIEDGTFKVSGKNREVDDFFSIRHNEDQILRVDTENQRILFAPGASSQYYIGIGVSEPKERLHVDGNLMVEGAGYFEELYITGSEGIDKIATENHVSGASGYLDNKTDFIFLKTEVETGAPFYGAKQPIPWDVNYTPRVVNTMVSPSGLNFFLSSTEGITQTGCWVHFSSDVDSRGFFIESFVSSEHWQEN
jgi:hypothetical protein